MEFLHLIWTNGASFLFILTVIIFVHEMGHYLIARRNGVRVEVFSIGFGREIFGKTDRLGTRWKISLLPFGGYVKMFGESAFSGAKDNTAPALTAEERKVSFYNKRLSQRAAIVVAGPLANFVLAVIILTVLFATAGQPFTPPNVGTVQSDSAAEEAGIQPGDLIVRIEGTRIERFEQVRQIVIMNPGTPLRITVEREGRELVLTATPKLRRLTDRFGGRYEVGLLGITSGKNMARVRHGPFTAAWRAVHETYRISAVTLQALGQIIAGTRSSEELGGPIRIAQLSSQVAEGGLINVFWFMALLSINLGLINLFPIPMLDGGHLLFYTMEAVRGKPLSEKFVEYGFRIGLGLVLTLVVFLTYQDLSRFQGLVEFFKGLIT